MLYEMKKQIVPLEVLGSHTDDEGNLHYGNSEVKHWKGISSDSTAT